MSFIYLPSVLVTPYKVFGLTLFAVEAIGNDLDTMDVYRINYGWFTCRALADNCASMLLSGQIE